MESWQHSLDSVLFNPPDPPDSKFFCQKCGDFFLPEDKVYDLDGEKCCERCAAAWLEDQWSYATEEQCYGE